MQITPVVEELCQPTLPPGGTAKDLMSTTNITRFVLIYDDAPGALRALCDKLLQEWLSALSETGDDVNETAAADLRLLFHNLLELYLDPHQNECEIFPFYFCPPLSKQTNPKRIEDCALPWKCFCLGTPLMFSLLA